MIDNQLEGFGYNKHKGEDFPSYVLTSYRLAYALYNKYIVYIEGKVPGVSMHPPLTMHRCR